MLTTTGCQCRVRVQPAVVHSRGRPHVQTFELAIMVKFFHTSTISGTRGSSIGLTTTGCQCRVRVQPAVVHSRGRPHVQTFELAIMVKFFHTSTISGTRGSSIGLTTTGCQCRVRVQSACLDFKKISERIDWRCLFPPWLLSQIFQNESTACGQWMVD